jgi:hypothetical protein
MCDGKLDAPPVGRSGEPQHETAMDQTPNDDRHGTLMRCGARGEFVQGRRGSIRQLLKHEELCHAHSKFAFDGARIDAEGADERAQSIHRLRDGHPLRAMTLWALLREDSPEGRRLGRA